MKKILLIISALIAVLFVAGQSPSFKTYMNPVIPGDHPDCTVTQVGKDFYTTGSSFNITPVIYHSTDLVHWEAISQPVSASWTNYDDKPGAGCWGGQIVYHKGKWWDYFSRAVTMYFVTADKPEGPWSNPTKVIDPSTLPYGLGYDNSIFIDDDNKWYLVVKNGQPNGGIVELGDNGQATGVVYDLNWLNPSPALPYSWAEGPVMWKYKGYYYYSFARDLAGGQKVMRSKTLTAEQSAWEMLGDFFNETDPKKGTSLFTSPNHASQAVMLGDSTSWVIHPLYAKDAWRGQGRQGLLNQVRYNASGKPTADYPINNSFTAPKLPSSGIPWMVAKSDFFSSDALNPEWSMMGYTMKNKSSLTDRPGWLRLTPKSSSRGNYLSKNEGEHSYSAITRLDYQPKSITDEAGLQIMRGDDSIFVKLCSSISAEGKKIIRYSYLNAKTNMNTISEVENTLGDTLWFKLVRINHKITGYFGNNGTDWTQIGQEFDVSIVDSYSDFVSFTGTRQGLYVQGTGNAWFDLYIYRDAYTPILMEWPANQFGTTRGPVVKGIGVLDNIHNNDWALYAGVEFGNNDYQTEVDSVEFTASCAASGGTVEVWLDSIATGTKIADCKIDPTGSLTTFKRFTAKVGAVKGNHDVYLNFVGAEGTTKLFQLKWMNFIRKSGTTSAFAPISQPGNVSFYPNPARTEIFIQSGFPFHTAEIFTMNGQRVFVSQMKKSENSSLNFNLANGLYLLKISGDQNTFCSKLRIDL